MYSKELAQTKGIYMITGMNNETLYVGYTMNSLSKRWVDHMKCVWNGGRDDGRLKDLYDHLRWNQPYFFDVLLTKTEIQKMIGRQATREDMEAFTEMFIRRLHPLFNDVKFEFSGVCSDEVKNSPYGNDRSHYMPEKESRDFFKRMFPKNSA